MSPYKVPFVDLPQHYQALKPELDPVVNEIMYQRSDFIMRRDLAEFEEAFAKRLGVKHCVGLNSCTDALLISLVAGGVGPGHEVITVAHTFVATVAAIHFSGAKPVLVDIGPDHLMDASLIKKAITPKTKAIIPVHLNGRICDMDPILQLAREHNLMVIEDAAQAVDATYKGRRAGAIGETGCFSFYPMKVLGCTGDGGALITNSDRIRDQAKLLRDHSCERSTGKIKGFGYNSRLDNLQAGILSVKLRHLDQWIARRRAIATRYQQGLKGVAGLTLPPAPASDDIHQDVFQNYVIQTEKRDALVEHLTASGIETLVSWRIPMHLQTDLKLSEFKLPMTEKISREVVSLPMNTEVTDPQIDQVIAAVRAFFKA